MPHKYTGKAPPIKRPPITAKKKVVPVTFSVMTMRSISSPESHGIAFGDSSHNGGTNILETLGINSSPAAETGAISDLDKDSKLKVAKITEGSRKGLTFHIQPNNPNFPSGSWSKKIMFDNLRDRKNWVRSCNFTHYTYKWYKDNKPMLNPRNYGIRLFTIYVEEMPNDSAIVKLGHFICERVNEDPANDTTLTVNKNNYVWVQEGMWSNVLGFDKALSELRREGGNFHIDYYAQKKNLIHSYFH